MRNRLSFVLIAAAVVGCGPSAEMPDVTLIHPPDGGPGDTGAHDRDMGPDMGPPSCSASGRVGAHCQGMANTCMTGSMCLNAGAATTIQMAFGIQAGILVDSMHMDYQAIAPAGTETAPFNGVSGGLCAQQCDTSVADTCGACTTCSNTTTQMPLIAAFGGIVTLIAQTSRQFGQHTGVCRIDCTYDAATAGAECPTGMTCDRFGGVCVESCTADSECNTNYGVTYAGQLVTIVDHSATADVCNMTTGRCEEPATVGTATGIVGTHCTSNQDCVHGGICLNGGHCAEFGCANANMMTGGCGGPGNNLGVCLTTSEAMHSSPLCITGCQHSSDCGPGNICNILYTDATHSTPFPIGGFAGYCIGQCNTDDECIATEACTDQNTLDTTGALVPNAGRCVPRCTDLGHVGTATTATAGQCLTTEWCEPDASAAAGERCTTDANCTHGARTHCFEGFCYSAVPTFGHCTPLGAFCGDGNTRSLAAVQGDCASTQVCDETLATPHNAMGGVSREDFGDGHCVAPCTSTSCTGGAVCVATGPLAGLCRHACTPSTGDAGMGTCPVDQVCDSALSYCVEVAPPAM